MIFATNYYIQVFKQISIATVCTSPSVAFELYGLFKMIDCFLCYGRLPDRQVTELTLPRFITPVLFSRWFCTRYCTNIHMTRMPKFHILKMYSLEQFFRYISKKHTLISVIFYQ
jgi:hypothetical protein